MCKKYPLQWLDLLVEEVLYPADQNKTNRDLSSKEKIEGVRISTERECSALVSEIRKHIFIATTDKKIKVIVRSYHRMLTNHINRFCQEKNPQSQKDFHAICDVIISELSEVISFLERDYFDCLDMDRTIPESYLVCEKNKLEVRLSIFKKSIDLANSKNSALLIVLNALDRFIGVKKHHYKVTYSSLHYRNELLRKLESTTKITTVGNSIFSKWDKVLVFMNFNSKSYMDFFIRRVLEKLPEPENISVRLNKLLKIYKEFKQLHSRSDISFNPDYTAIDQFLSNWFEQEIEFLRNVQNYSPVHRHDDEHQKALPIKTGTSGSKVICNLSSDQTALLIRAADDTRLLTARSMTEVFRTIIPSLSTKCRKDLSYESVRIKSYNPEERDKEAVIQTLESMIRKIREY